MCHCFECQRRTGSTFGVQAFYPREQVRHAKGIAKRYARRADSGRTVTFNFCPECGGTVFWEPEQRPELIAVAVGMFADPDFAKPRNSVWEKISILGQPQSLSNKLNIRTEGRQNYHGRHIRVGCKILGFSYCRNVQVCNPIGINFPREVRFDLRQQIVASLLCQSEMIRSRSEVGCKSARRISTAPRVAAVGRRLKAAARGKLCRNWS